VRACSYVALFLRTTAAAFFRVRMSMFTRDCTGGCCVEFMRPFEQELWSQLSVRPLTSAFLVSSQTPYPSLPSSTCHFPLLKGTAPPRELRKRGFLHIKLKRGLSSCSTSPLRCYVFALSFGAKFRKLIFFFTCGTGLKVASFHLKYACGFVEYERTTQRMCMF